MGTKRISAPPPNIRDEVNLVLPVLLRLADVGLVADLGHLLGFGEEFLGLVGISLLDREVADLAEQEVVELAPVWLLGVEAERVLAFLDEGGVEAPEVPVAAFDGLALLGLALAHTGLQTVVDTGSVGDDDAGTVPSLSFADSLEGLSVVCTHCNLSDIDVAVGGGNHAEVLLADTLTLGSELSDSTERRSLGSLATGVGVNLRVEHEDVHIFACSDDVVETAVTDVIGSTVTTDDPLAALHEIVVEGLQLSAGGTAGSSASGNGFAELRSNLLGLISIFAVGNPFLSQSLVIQWLKSLQILDRIDAAPSLPIIYRLRFRGIFAFQTSSNRYNINFIVIIVPSSKVFAGI